MAIFPKTKHTAIRINFFIIIYTPLLTRNPCITNYITAFSNIIT